MKQQITTYFREHYNIFKQKPLQGSAVLAMQIPFLLGWAMFFYFSLKDFFVYYIPGNLQTKGNIYAELTSDSIILILYSFVFYKFSKIMLSNQSGTKSKMLIIAASVVSAIIWPELEYALFKMFNFLPETHIAFWAN